jgi:pantoate--beta-alanine ligase
MEIIRSIVEMSIWSRRMWRAGNTICLVPTMGFFHAGHLELMQHGRQEADQLVVSLFVNPIQFGPNEDYNRYPRDLDRDASLAEKEQADILFVPESNEMYADGFQTSVRVERLTETLCGEHRPGHFDGVATVVAKLFNIVRPHSVIFGEKDFQQLVVIRRLVDDLNFDVNILGHAIVREDDGLAMSSRNTYLNDEERQSALCLYKSLLLTRRQVAAGDVDVATLLPTIESYILSYAGVVIEYIKIVDQNTLLDKQTVDESAILVMAIRIGKTRLIDNGRLFV